jgi:hypothetical protein
MSTDALLRRCLVSLEVNETFSEAVIGMADGSRIAFCHRVGERWSRAEGDGQAAEVLARIAQFRLNGKHLDVRFEDGSRWEARFGAGR